MGRKQFESSCINSEDPFTFEALDANTIYFSAGDGVHVHGFNKHNLFQYILRTNRSVNPYTNVPFPQSDLARLIKACGGPSAQTLGDIAVNIATHLEKTTDADLSRFYLRELSLVVHELFFWFGSDVASDTLSKISDDCVDCVLTRIQTGSP